MTLRVPALHTAPKVVDLTTRAVNLVRQHGNQDLDQCADRFDGILSGRRSVAMACIDVMDIANRAPVDENYIAMHALADVWFDLAAQCSGAKESVARNTALVEDWLTVKAS